MPGWPTFLEAANGSNGAGLTVATAKITKTAGADSTFDAGASSVETIAGDGFAETVAATPLKNVFWGLSDVDTDVSYTSIDYGLQLDGAGVLNVYEGGALRATSTYAAGDVLRVERVGTAIRYYSNGELIYSSGVASTGSLRVDSSIYQSSGIVGGIRLFDATANAFRALTWQGVANVTITADTALTARRLTIAGPTLAQPGDHVIAIIAGQGPDWIVAKSADWEHVNTFRASTVPWWFAVLRRTFDDADPASYTFDLAVDQQALGAILTYRNVPVAAAAMSAASFAANTVGLAPASTMARPTDLHLVGAFVAGASVPTHSPRPNATSRADLTATLDSVAARLVVCESAPRLVGTSQVGLTFNGSTSGAAFSIALPGLPELGRELAFSPIVPGAIGLPIKGI